MKIRHLFIGGAVIAIVSIAIIVPREAEPVQPVQTRSAQVDPRAPVAFEDAAVGLNAIVGDAEAVATQCPNDVHIEACDRLDTLLATVSPAGSIEGLSGPQIVEAAHSMSSLRAELAKARDDVLVALIDHAHTNLDATTADADQVIAAATDFLASHPDTPDRAAIEQNINDLRVMLDAVTTPTETDPDLVIGQYDLMAGDVATAVYNLRELIGQLP